MSIPNPNEKASDFLDMGTPVRQETALPLIQTNNTSARPRCKSEDQQDLELKELQMQINKAGEQPQEPATIENMQEYKARAVGMINETQSESNATLQVNHLTTNLSESSGFGEGPTIVGPS